MLSVRKNKKADKVYNELITKKDLDKNKVEVKFEGEKNGFIC